MPSSLPSLGYYVAFSNSANDDPALITTIASPPGALGAVNVWTDVSRFVTADTGDRGRSHELQAMEAGTRQLTLRNDDSRFTPWNASGPYTGLLVPRKPFQVRANWLGTNYPRFTGQVDSWAVVWPDAKTQLTTLHVTDAFRMLNLANITTGGYPAQVLANGVSVYYRMGEPVGASTAIDSSGNGLNGTYQGGYTLGNTGPLLANTGTAVNLMSAGSVPLGWLNVPATAAPSGVTWTLETWVNSPAWADGGSAGAVLLYWYDVAGDNGTVWIDTPGRIQLSVTIGGSTVIQLNTTASIPAAGWHHIAVTRNSTAVAMYIDGVNQTLTTTSTSSSTFTPTTTFIGWTNGAAFPGSLQEFAVYKTVALSAGQVAADYQLAVFPQEGTGARIGRVANAVAWSAGARAIDAGISTMQAVTSSLTTTSSLSHMQSVEATEGGALFIGTSGKVTFLGRQTLFSNTLYTTSQATFGDNTAGGDIPFLPAPTLARDDIDLFNEAAAQRTGGNMMITDNAASIAANGRVTWSPPAALNGISDSEVLGLCQYVVQKYSTAVDRLAAITVDLVSVAAAFPAKIPALLSLDLMYQITVERTIMPGNATTFNQVGVIEHITETLDAVAGTWTLTFGLALSDPAWWILGTSQLGINNRLAW